MGLENETRWLVLFRYVAADTVVAINANIDVHYLWKVIKEAQTNNLLIKTYCLVDQNCYGYLVSRRFLKSAEKSISLLVKKYSLLL